MTWLFRHGHHLELHLPDTTVANGVDDSLRAIGTLAEARAGFRLDTDDSGKTLVLTVVEEQKGQRPLDSEGARTMIV